MDSRCNPQHPAAIRPAASPARRAAAARLLLLWLLLALAALPAAAQSLAPVDSARVRIVSIKGSLARPRDAVVVLPRGYAADSRRYPVLYLLHGLWGGHRNWLELTNLLAYTEELPLIVVLPDAGDSWYTNSASKPEDRFEDYVGKDVPAYVEQHFRTLPLPTARYIAGLSMGGFGAFKLALKNPERYSLVASFSGAFRLPNDTTMPSIREAFGPVGSEARAANDVTALLRQAQFREAPYFYLDCGSADHLLGVNREVAAVLAARRLPYEYHEVGGTHNWEYWNRRLPVVLELVRERIRRLP